MEENNQTKETKKPGNALTIVCKEGDRERFNEIHQSLHKAGLSFVLGDTFNALLNSHLEPAAIQDDRDKLNARIKQLEQQLEEKQQRVAELEAQAEADTLEKNRYAQQTQQAQLELEQARQLHASELEAAQLKPGVVPITFTEDNIKVLDYVCERESRKRRQHWTRSHVINFFVWSRFVKGQLNGDMDSVPDSALRRLGVSHRPQKLEVPAADEQPAPESNEQKEEEITL